MLAFAFAGLLLIRQGPAAPPAPPERYRLVVKTYGEQDLTGEGRGKMTGSLTATAIITVTSSDTADGQLVKVTVDSMALDPSGTIADQLQQRPNAAQDARGAFVRVYVAHGLIRGPMLLSDSTNPALSVVTQAVGVLFPGVRRGAKVGDSWADTSHINNATGTRKQTGEVIATWKVAAIEGTALVLDGASQTHTRAEDGNGQEMTLTGTSTEHVVVPPQGPVRSASIETANIMSITAPQLTAPIPGKTTGSLELVPLKR